MSKKIIAIIITVIVVIGASIGGYALWRSASVGTPTAPAQPIDEANRPVQKEIQSSDSNTFESSR